MTPPYTVESLCTQIQFSGLPNFVFFWGHTPDKSGALSKACFSQWWSAPFVVDGFTYQTAEHYMMAQKALLFGDQSTFTKVLAATNPKEAKHLGRSVSNFNETAWIEERFRIVVEANYAKFSQHSDLKDLILNTGDQVLVEASPVDPIWGIGMSAADARIENPNNWKGSNLLGFALMEVRDLLASEKSI